MSLRSLYYLFFIVLFPVLLSACTKTPIAVSNKIDTTVVIDGKADEWDSTFIYDRSSKFQYSISSDSNNLYVCTKIANEDLENKIKVYGLTLWIDTTGKHKQQIGIRYPIGAKNLKSKEVRKDFNKQNIKEKKDDQSKFLAGTNEIEVKGLNMMGDQKNEFSRTDAKSKIGIHAAMNYDSTNAMIYELKIPLKLISSKKSANNFGLTFLTGSMGMEERSEIMEDANKPGSVQTGMSGYATGNQRNMPKNAQYQNLLEPTELKVNISIQ